MITNWLDRLKNRNTEGSESVSGKISTASTTEQTKKQLRVLREYYLNIKTIINWTDMELTNVTAEGIDREYERMFSLIKKILPETKKREVRSALKEMMVELSEQRDLLKLKPTDYRSKQEIINISHKITDLMNQARDIGAFDADTDADMW
jgi:hypothetical protein